jgi:hypothetical protein
MIKQPRVSRCDLHQLADRLSQRDWNILHFINRHRYATTGQLRRLYFATHATQSAATRACTRVLGRLLKLRLLTRLERRIGGDRHGSAAFIWCLDVVGERLQRLADGKRRRFHEPSFLFLQHSLTITDIHVQLVEAERTGCFNLTQVAIETEAWRPYLTPHGVTTLLKPDMMLSLANHAYRDYWYLEVDLASESLPVLMRKCHAYEDYRHTGQAQQEHQVFPRVLWVMPTPERIPRGVLLKRPPNQRCAFWVDINGVDQPPVEVLAHIQITKLGPPGRAAVLGLVMHLVRDVLAALPDLYLVHDVSDGLHGISHIPLTELFLGRDELDAHGRQDALGDGGIGVVTERAGAHVDHHVADLRGGFDVAQQLAENRAFGDGLGRVAWFDELAGDRCVQATTALRANLTLGGDGVAVLVDVDGGVHLPGCRHP